MAVVWMKLTVYSAVGEAYLAIHKTEIVLGCSSVDVVRSRCFG